MSCVYPFCRSHTHNSQRALTRTHYTMLCGFYFLSAHLCLLFQQVSKEVDAASAGPNHQQALFVLSRVRVFKWINAPRARGSEGHSDGPQGADRPFNINYSRPELVVLMRAHATSPYSLPKGFLPVAPLLGWAGLSSFREIVCHQVDFSKQLFPRWIMEQLRASGG
jgi:hypothetical protein